MKCKKLECPICRKYADNVTSEIYLAVTHATPSIIVEDSIADITEAIEYFVKNDISFDKFPSLDIQPMPRGILLKKIKKNI
jgi:hypothetical protein